MLAIVPVLLGVSATSTEAQASVGAEACGAASSGNGSLAATTIADFAWLQGTWRGEGPGGATAEVHYLAPQAGVIPSVFWLYGDERVMVLETVTLVEEDDGIMLYVRHFTPSLVPWEAERALAQRLVAREGDRFTFENLYDEDPRCTVLERLGSDRFRAWSLLLRAGGMPDEIRVEYRRAEEG